LWASWPKYGIRSNSAIIGKCFLLLVRSYDGSLMKVCGILFVQAIGGLSEGEAEAEIKPTISLY